MWKLSPLKHFIWCKKYTHFNNACSSVDNFFCFFIKAHFLLLNLPGKSYVNQSRHQLNNYLTPLIVLLVFMNENSNFVWHLWSTVIINRLGAVKITTTEYQITTEMTYLDEFKINRQWETILTWLIDSFSHGTFFSVLYKWQMHFLETAMQNTI